MTNGFKGFDVLDTKGFLYKNNFERDKTTVEKDKEATLALLFNSFNRTLQNMTGELKGKNIFKQNKTYGYLENYGYYELTHNSVSSVLPKFFNTVEEIYDYATNAFLRVHITREEEIKHDVFKDLFDAQDTGIRYFKEIYIYTKQLEFYNLYYEGNIPGKEINRLLVSLNRTLRYTNPEIDNAFEYDANQNHFVLPRKALKKINR